MRGRWFETKETAAQAIEGRTGKIVIVDQPDPRS
jgi:hypothetical protein